MLVVTPAHETGQTDSTNFSPQMYAKDYESFLWRVRLCIGFKNLFPLQRQQEGTTQRTMSGKFNTDAFDADSGLESWNKKA